MAIDGEKGKKKLAIGIDVKDRVFYDLVTSFGTIREDRTRGGRVRSEVVEFDLDMPSLDTEVPSRLAQALIKLGFDPCPSLEEEMQQISAAVLSKLPEHADVDGFFFVQFDLETSNATTIEVGEDLSRWLGSFVETWTCGHDGAAARACSPQLDGCPICLNGFVAGEEIAQTDCAHVFHLRCIARWLCNSLSCPMCRTTLPC